MHPNGIFDWTDREEMLRFVQERSFAHIFTAGPDGPAVLHAPLFVVDGRIQFHVARRNRAVGGLSGQKVLLSIAGRDGYQSANWYASADQVPTWHYETVEIEGIARELGEDELVALLDGFSDLKESVHSPERPWTRAKMAPGKFDAMLNAIVGFEIEPVSIRGTRKFNQHKGEADTDATIAGQATAGRLDIVDAIRELRP